MSNSHIVHQSIHAGWLAVAVAAGVLIPAAAGAQSLNGSAASLDRQNRQAALDDFTFLRTAADVKRLEAAGLLVPVGGNRDYTLDDVSYRLARPEVRLFIERLSGQYRGACGEPLVVTSLTRPVTEQPDNASPRSVHPTGMAADLRRPASGPCLRWLERTLLSLEKKGVIEVTLEHAPPHLHVAVFPRPYAAYVAALAEVSVSRVLADARRAASYKVRRADTLWGIAQQFDTTPDALRRVNHLASDAIRPGQVLEIPAPDDSGI